MAHAERAPPEWRHTCLCPLMSDWSQIPPSDILKNKILLLNQYWLQWLCSNRTFCKTQSHGTESAMLGFKLYSGTSKTKENQAGLVWVSLLWNSHWGWLNKKGTQLGGSHRWLSGLSASTKSKWVQIECQSTKCAFWHGEVPLYNASQNDQEPMTDFNLLTGSS